jgi:uncharacterized protein with ParB-like and HNH nuclease domain
VEAAEAKIQKVLEGSKQFLVPHYQRPYSWKEEQWQVLWNDLGELLEDADPKPHFLGSIVSSPARSVPEGVEKRLLIDGQQRLTTLLVLLTLIRDRARETGATRLAERIQDLVTNRHEDGHDHYKLLPTQGEDPSESDRETFIRLVSGTSAVPKTGIGASYHFFDSKLRRANAPDLDSLMRVITGKLTLVSIILDEKDNPHRIFESLNGKGRPLSHADLIRNYFFMRIHEGDHERIYVDLWRPMQRRLGEEALTDFVRHYLTQRGQVIRETDIYTALKATVDTDADKIGGPIDHLKRLVRYSEHYAVLLRPETAQTERLRERLARLNRLEVTVAYPFLLSVYTEYAAGSLPEAAFVTILDTLENFLVRRFVCGVPTHGLNKIFAPLYEQATRASDGDLVAGVRKTLSANSRAYPKDDDFRTRLKSARLYGGGERREKTKLILERLEEALKHKEVVVTGSLTIEHVMPQTLTAEWRAHLGSSAEEDHEEFLHTLGNLTLTSYNAELSNSSFEEKKKLFATSHIELNRHFGELQRWTADEIEQRAEVLADSALAIWPYFGAVHDAEAAAASGAGGVTGKVPKSVRVRESVTPVQSWVDVATATMEGIVALGAEEFERVVGELPRLVNPDATAFRRSSSRLRKLSNGAYIETNLSASQIYRLCLQAAQLAGLGPGEWQVEIAATLEEDDDEDSDHDSRTPTQVQQLQHQFWTEVREALVKTGKFPSLRAPQPRYWYNIVLGRSWIWLSLTANAQDGQVGIKVNLRGESADQALEKLREQRNAIEHEVGVALEWNRFPAKRTKTVRTVLPCDLADRSAWPAAIDWLTRMAIAFRAAFGSRAADLDLR